MPRRSRSRPGSSGATARVRPRVRAPGGVWRFLTAARGARLEPFVRQYRVVRQREGRRPKTPDYYRRLPSVAPDDPHAGDWHVRRETYHHLLGHVLAAGASPLRDSRSRRRQRLAFAIGWPRSAMTPSRSTRSTTRSTASGAARHYPTAFRVGAGRFRRAAVRARAVRSRRLQRIAALCRRHRGDARARTPGAGTRRRAGRDGLADVPRGRRRVGDGRRDAAALRPRVRLLECRPARRRAT